MAGTARPGAPVASTAGSQWLTARHQARCATTARPAATTPSSTRSRPGSCSSGSEVKSLRVRPRAAGRRLRPHQRRRGAGSRACTSPPTPSPTASAPTTRTGARKLLLHRERDRQAGGPGRPGAPDPRARSPIYFKDGRAKVELALGQGPPARATSARRWPSVTPGGRRRGPSAASARAWPSRADRGRPQGTRMPARSTRMWAVAYVETQPLPPWPGGSATRLATMSRST